MKQSRHRICNRLVTSFSSSYLKRQNYAKNLRLSPTLMREEEPGSYVDVDQNHGFTWKDNDALYSMNETQANLSTLPLIISANPNIRIRGETVTDHGKFQVSTLDNGATIATVDTPLPQGNLRMYVKSGARSETFHNLGYSHFLKHLAFSRTLNRSPVRLNREFEHLTAQFSSTAHREFISVGSPLLSENIQHVLPIFLDVARPKLREYIMRETADMVISDSQFNQHSHHTRAVDLLHRTAYRNRGLGNSIYCDSHAAEKFVYEPLERLEDYILKHYQPENMVLIGVGIPHDIFKNLAAGAFHSLDLDQDYRPDEDWKPLPADPIPASPYVGGESLVLEDSNTNLILAFEGVKHSDPDWAAVEVLTHMIGGGSRYTANGPGGRGRGSRLIPALEKSSELSEKYISGAAFNINYSDSGLFGVQLETEVGHSRAATEFLTGVLAGLNSGSEEEITRAKRQAIAHWLKSVESAEGMGEYIGRVVVGGMGQLVHPREFVKQFENVRGDQIERAAKRMLKSTPTLVGIGDITDVPLLKDVQARFKQ